MEQWQHAAARQAELLTHRLNEALTEGLAWLRSELGVDLGLKPELIPPWVLLPAACGGLLLLVCLWASLLRAVFKKRTVHSSADDGADVKRAANKAVKSEEPKKKRRKSEKARKRN